MTYAWKSKRTCSSVAWRMCERANDVIIPPHPTPPRPPPMTTCPNWRLQRSIYFMCKFTWTLIHAPPHPTPPHPTHHGRLKDVAVVQLYTHNMIGNDMIQHNMLGYNILRHKWTYFDIIEHTLSSNNILRCTKIWYDWTWYDIIV